MARIERMEEEFKGFASEADLTWSQFPVSGSGPSQFVKRTTGTHQLCPKLSRGNQVRLGPAA